MTESALDTTAVEIDAVVISGDEREVAMVGDQSR